ncbi:hypothetical protein L3Q82_026523, partial [Scortum barcoo]
PASLPAYLTVSRPAGAQIGSSPRKDRNRMADMARHKGQAGPVFTSMTAEQNVAGGGLSGRARGDLATSFVELVWLVTQRQVPEMCYSSIDRPGEQRASPSPSPSLMPSPMAADATWRPQSLQPARRRRRAPAGSPKPMSMSCTEKAFSAGRQAACRPLLSPFLGGRV